MSMLTSGELPVLILLLLLLYWLWRVRMGGRHRRVMTEAGALALIERTLPPVWTDLWTGRETPSTFSLSSWRKPSTYFLGPADLQSHAPGLTGLCPLIERNGEAIIGRLPDGRFVEFYYEDGLKGDAAIKILGRNYQEFVLALLLELEDIGMRDESIAFAAATQFAHLAEFIDVIDQQDAGEEALQALRDRIARND
jgi:hypothetical protein